MKKEVSLFALVVLLVGGSFAQPGVMIRDLCLTNWVWLAGTSSQEVAAVNARIDAITPVSLGVATTGALASAVAGIVTNGSSASLMDVTLGGRFVAGLYGVSLAYINSGADGASQWGVGGFGASLIGPWGRGSAQHGYNDSGAGSWYLNAAGASQWGYNAEVNPGYISATNLGPGAMQLFCFDLFDVHQHAMTTAGGGGSFMLGAGVASNKHALVVGNGSASHGDGSITASGGFYGFGGGLWGVPLGTGVVTNYGSAILSELTWLHYTNGVDATKMLVTMGEDAPTAATGLYSRVGGSGSFANANLWVLAFEGSYYLTSPNGQVPSYSYIFTGANHNLNVMGTGLLYLDRVTGPLPCETGVVTADGIEGAYLRAGSVALAALGFTPLLPAATGGLATVGSVVAVAASGSNYTDTVVGAVTNRVQARSFVLTNPTSGGGSPLWRLPGEITVLGVHVLCMGGTSIVGNFWEYDANGANGSTVDGDITAVSGSTVDDDGTLSNPVIAAGNYLGWKTTTVNGVVTRAIITVDYR